MSLKVYYYSNCGTCRKALKFLDDHEISYTLVPIRENPPTKAELKRMLAQTGDSRKLFNTSGKDYKELNLKARLPEMNDRERLELLASNGNLVKRPVAVALDVCLVGFDEQEWRDALL